MMSIDGQKTDAWTGRQALRLLALWLLLLAGESADGRGLAMLDEVDNWTLDEVMQQAIEHAPDLAIAREQRRLSEGVLQESSGGFDPIFNVSLTASHQQGQLLPPVRRQQEGNRNIFIILDREFRSIADDLERQLAEGEGPVGVDCGEGNQIIIDGEDICETQERRRQRLEFAELIDLLIDQEPDPEREERLRQIRLDQISDNRDTIRSLIDELRFQAELARDALFRLGGVPPVEVEDSLLLDIGYNFAFRNGQSLTPQLLFEGTNNNFRNKDRSPGLGGKGVPLRFRTAAGLTWNVPLGRGGGRVTAEAPERAARHNLDAASKRYRHSASRLALDITVLYLQIAAAEERLELQRQLLDSQLQLRSLVETLVQARELAEVDLRQSVAGVAQARAQVNSARTQLRDLRLQLALLIGLDVSAASLAPISAAALPDLPSQPDDCKQGSAALISRALAHRQDYAALTSLSDSAAVLMAAADHDRKPRLDFSLTVAFSALAEGPPVSTGFARTLEEDIVGPSLFLSLRGELPRANHTASGRFRQSVANQSTAEIRLVEAQRAIRQAIPDRIAGVNSTHRQALERQRALAAFAQTLAADRQRLQAGESTVLDLIVSQDRYNAAALAELEARFAYWVATALLRHEISALLEFDVRGEPEQLIDPTVTSCKQVMVRT